VGEQKQTPVCDRQVWFSGLFRGNSIRNRPRECNSVLFPPGSPFVCLEKLPERLGLLELGFFWNSPVKSESRQDVISAFQPVFSAKHDDFPDAELFATFDLTLKDFRPFSAVSLVGSENAQLLKKKQFPFPVPRNPACARYAELVRFVMLHIETVLKVSDKDFRPGNRSNHARQQIQRRPTPKKIVRKYFGGEFFVAEKFYIVILRRHWIQGKRGKRERACFPSFAITLTA